MGGNGNDMEALSPRDANARQAKKPQELKQAVVNLKNARDRGSKDAHPPPPPAFVTEPPCRDRREGAVYEIRNCLGKGGFAICYEGKLNGTSKRYALKIVKAAMPQKMEQKFQTELQIHSKMRQQNIVQFHRAFTFEASTYLVLELCPNGSLMDMVKRRRGLTEPEVRYYAVQITGAIKYMHSKGIIHRDLKMGNIFLDRHMNAKVGDFGLAALLVTGKDMHTIRRTTLCGTPNYIAPEILEKGRKGHDHLVDIWSLGIIVFAMLTTKPPFQSTTTDEIYRKARDREYEWPEIPSKYFSREVKDLVDGMLQNAEVRPEPDVIVQHGWFYSGYLPEPSDMTVKLRECPPDNEAFYARNSTAQVEKSRRTLKDMCRECGVGPWDQPSGVIRQIWRECAEEEQQGLTPVIPLAKGIVYRPFDEVKTELKLQQELKLHRQPTSGYQSSAGSSRTAGLDSDEDELSSGNEAAYRPSKASTSTTAAPSVATTAGLLRAPPQSFAAQQRMQNKPPTGTFRSQQPSQPPSEPAPKPMESLRRGLRGPRGGDRALAAAQATATASNDSPQMDEAGPSRQPGHGRTRSTSSQSTIRASEHNRPQQAQPESSRGQVPASAEQFELPSRSERPSCRLQAPPVRPPRPDERSEKSRGKMPATGDGNSDSDGSDRTVRPTQRGQDKEIDPRDLMSRDNRPAVGERRDQAPPRPPQATLDQMMEHLQMRENLERPRDLPTIFSPKEPQEQVQGSEPDVILAGLKKLQNELERALNSRSMTIVSSKDKAPAPPRIVVKWVDYTNKFGIGYILDDGSVGCLLKTFEQPESVHGTTLKLPPCFMVVHGAERHFLRKDDLSYPNRHQIVPQDQTIYIYENNGEAGLTRVRVDPKTFHIETNPDGTAGKLANGKDIYDHRKRERLILWKKFANYMVAFGRGMDERVPIDKYAITRADPRVAHEDIVTFYQRMGDVGCWIFADGHMQFNFPDHTKIVLDSTGTWCHFWHLTIEEAQYLAQSGHLTDGALDNRTVLTYPLQTLLNFHVPAKQPLVSTRRRPEIPVDMRDIPNANQFRKKIEFIRDMVREWTKNGGLGNIDMSRHHRLKWTGTRETHVYSQGELKPAAPFKMIWVTVGARWGDPQRVACYVNPQTGVMGDDVDETSSSSRRGAQIQA